MEPTSPQTVSRTCRLPRYLRIAFSVTCGIACVLLAMLWVRSYWWNDLVWGITPKQGLLLQSEQGGLRVNYLDVRNASVNATIFKWHYESKRVTSSSRNKTTFFAIEHQLTGLTIAMPHWLTIALIAVVGGSAALPRLPRQFSLRTLLFAATVVAVGLGVVVMMLSGS